MSRFSDLLSEQVKVINGDQGDEKRPLQEWQQIFDQAQDQLMANIEQIAPDVMVSARQALKRVKKRRLREMRHNERAHLKKLGIGFRRFNDAIALAEALNRDIFDAFGEWLQDKETDEVAASCLGIPSVVGGPAVRVLTFLGLHARACTLASEITLLAQRGFTEGAHARARSLYELVTIATFLAVEDSSPYELTERYSLSGMVEARRDNQHTGDEDPFDDVPGLEEAIRNSWGDSYFKPYGWAIPGVGDGTAKQVTFRDIEKSLEADHLRHAYLTMNHAVHAGAGALLQRFDPRYPFRNPIGSTVDYYGAAWVLAATAYLFRGIQIPLLLEIAPLLGAEMELMLAPLGNLCEASESFFKSHVES
ncbi:DUF5677 domain-containing protein [Streptomyces griseorubiginosus]|uniref:DUF5677 domain-containing protein n=1 Tax=Streptomyces griseorubiginosus TaxID=67304 RepID=UPI003317FA72